MALGIAKLSGYWRVAGTGLCFALFGLGALYLAIAWFPAVRLACRDAERRKAVTQAGIRTSFRVLLRALRLLRVIDCRIEGEALLAQEQGCLVIANHPSLLDFVLMASIMGRCDCIAKREVWSNPFMRGVVNAAGYIPNAEGPELLDRCRTVLGDRGVLLVFPEGTRSRLGQPIALTRGAANIAVRLDYDLRVVTIECRPPFLPKGAKWYRPSAAKPCFRVVVRQRIAVRPFIEAAPSLAVAARHVNARIAEILAPYRLDTLGEAQQQ